MPSSPSLLEGKYLIRTCEVASEGLPTFWHFKLFNVDRILKIEESLKKGKEDIKNLRNFSVLDMIFRGAMFN